MTTILSSKQPSEAYFISFDFALSLGSETVLSATVSASDIATNEDMTATIIEAAKQNNTDTVVYVWVKSGITGSNYLITCVVTGSSGSVYELEAILPVCEIPSEAPDDTCGLVITPSSEPVSIDEFLLHARIDSDTADAESGLISDIIITAREHIEDITRRALITQTWGYCLDRWPSCDRILLPNGNLQSVTWIKWKDSAGVVTTLTAGKDYLVETKGEWPGAIVLPYGGSWPAGELYPSNPIIIRFVCGWVLPSLVPNRIKSAIKILAADMYANRETNIIGRSVTVTRTVENLLAPFRIWGFA